MDLSFFGLSNNPFSDDADTESSNGEKMTEKETGAYIRRCLRTAGTMEQIFFANAIRKIFSYSNGNIKVTNKICNLALEHAQKKGEKQIDSDIITECIEDFLDSDQEGTVFEERRRHPRIPTELEGNYFINTSKERGMLTVTNISLSGVQVKLNKQRVLKFGDRVIIAFHLDDDARTEIREMMVVRNVIGFFAGLAYNAQPNTNAYEAYINQKLE